MFFSVKVCLFGILFREKLKIVWTDWSVWEKKEKKEEEEQGRKNKGVVLILDWEKKRLYGDFFL